MVRKPVQSPVNMPVILGYYSPSQNGIVVSPIGIALCLAGGGKGHDMDKPKILIEYETEILSSCNTP